MPVTIYPSTLKIKDTNGTFHGADCIKGDTGPQGPHGSPIDVQVDGVSVVTNDVAHIDISGKADKVNNATTGNFAGLDAAGNLIDSGKCPDDITGVAPAIVKSASGAVAVFEDGAEKPVKSLVVGIEPVQDLHGYDSPWPAGGGKNLLKTDGLTYTPPSGTDWGNTAKRTFTADSYCVGCASNNYYMPNQLTEYSVSSNRITVTSGASAYGVNIPIIGLTVGETYTLSATSSEGNIQIGAWQQDGTSIGNITPGTNIARTFTVPENAYYIVLCFLVKTNNVQAVFTDIQLEKSSTATSYSPYSNICPISGWTGAKVTRTGKNLFDKSEYMNLVSNYDYVDSSYLCRRIQLKPNTTYTVSFSAEAASSGVIALINKYSQVNRAGFFDLRKASDVKTYTTDDSGCLYIGVYHFASDTSYNNRLNECEIQIEVGSSATDYEPYQGEEVTVQLGQTVYGGTLDVTNGTLTVDRATVDLGTLSWSKNGDRFNVATKIVPNPKSVSVWNANSPMAICSAYKYGNIGNGNGVDKAIGFYAGYLYARDTAYENADDFKNGCSGVQLVYELETPITYTLTPQEVTTLLGSNRIWADCGDTAVDYCADTKMYVDGAVPVQDVQVNGTSVLSNGIANIPVSAEQTYGVMRTNGIFGVYVNSSGFLQTSSANTEVVKAGTDTCRTIKPSNQHEATFYGLAKAAGDTTQASSSNAVGTYTDTAKDKIQQMLGIDSLVARHEGTAASSSIAVGETFIFNGKLYSATSAIAEGDAIAPGVNCSETTLADLTVRDVQVNGTSVLSNGVANVPIASSSTLGVMKINTAYGLNTNENGELYTLGAGDGYIKVGDNLYRPITPGRQHRSVFYGLAKAAGDTTQSQSDNAIGTYTDEAKTAIRSMLGAIGNTNYATSSTGGVVKIDLANGLYIAPGTGQLYVNHANDEQVKIASSDTRAITPTIQHASTFYGLAKAAGDTTQASSDNAVGTYTETAQSKIHEMLDAPVTVSGTDPVITGKAGIRYICGECDTLTLTPPASGIVDVVFTSGTTATVLSVPNTVKWPDWFSPDSLETSATYEINIMNGTLGAVGIWT